jgi:hypothetical protein
MRSLSGKVVNCNNCGNIQNCLKHTYGDNLHLLMSQNSQIGVCWRPESTVLIWDEEELTT